jgi:hypothetical protein
MIALRFNEAIIFHHKTKIKYQNANKSLDYCLKLVYNVFNEMGEGIPATGEANTTPVCYSCGI